MLAMYISRGVDCVDVFVRRRDDERVFDAGFNASRVHRARDRVGERCFDVCSHRDVGNHISGHDHNSGHDHTRVRADDADLGDVLVRVHGGGRLVGDPGGSGGFPSRIARRDDLRAPDP